jgi:ubiquinone/menaquinone biosynthesis C-methylase UbiE
VLKIIFGDNYMNNLRVVCPVHMSDEHLLMVQMLLARWLESDVLNLGVWTQDKPDNMTMMNMEKILALEGMDTKIPYDNESHHNCLCVEVLEHMKEPVKLVNEIYRVLKPGGQVYIEVPFLEPFESSHPDYFRFTPAGLKHLFSKFTVDEFGIANGPASTMHWVSRIYHSLKFDRLGGIEDLMGKTGDENFCEAYNTFGVAFEDIKIRDEDLNYKEHALTIACSYYLLATKPKLK